MQGELAALSRKTEKQPKHRSPSAKTPGQRHYIKEILAKDIVICQGPAGTGKTHLAVGMAVSSLRKGEVQRIIIARPVVEAGEQIGFLPGELEKKMNPFVRPCLDELSEYASNSEIVGWQNEGILEIAPIGFMRGRTFKDSFIVCDECQNLDFNQMEMLLTRFGMQSKMVLTGDASQSDLLKNSQGAFAYACALFENDDEISVVHLDNKDNQRNPLVGKIIDKWKSNLYKFRETGKINA